jgi:hypothetical protein
MRIEPNGRVKAKLLHELLRTPLPCTGVKIALATAYFHGFGVARAGPWNTRVNKDYSSRRMMQGLLTSGPGPKLTVTRERGRGPEARPARGAPEV